MSPRAGRRAMACDCPAAAIPATTDPLPGDRSPRFPRNANALGCSPGVFLFRRSHDRSLQRAPRTGVKDVRGVPRRGRSCARACCPPRPTAAGAWHRVRAWISVGHGRQRSASSQRSPAAWACVPSGARGPAVAHAGRPGAVCPSTTIAQPGSAANALRRSPVQIRHVGLDARQALISDIGIAGSIPVTNHMTSRVMTTGTQVPHRKRPTRRGFLHRDPSRRGATPKRRRRRPPVPEARGSRYRPRMQGIARGAAPRLPHRRRLRPATPRQRRFHRLPGHRARIDRTRGVGIANAIEPPRHPDPQQPTGEHPCSGPGGS